MSRARPRDVRPARIDAGPRPDGGSLIGARTAPGPWAGILATALSATLYALAFPPVAARALAWIALVPLLVALRDAPLGRRLALGVVWTLLVGWGVGTWMPGAVSGYFHQSLAVGLALFLLVTGAMAAPYYVAFAAAYRPLAARWGAAGPLLAGAAWAAAELARGRLLNGTIGYVGNSPWATLGYSQAGVTSVLQIASLTGVYGVSFVVAAVNAGVAEVVYAALHGGVDRRAWRALVAATSVAAVAWASGAVAVRRADARRSDAASVPIAIAQANLGAAARWGSEGEARTLEAYMQLTRDAVERATPATAGPGAASRRPVVVFWPEAAVTFFLEQDPLYGPAFAAAARERAVELVVGAPRAVGPDGAPPFTNSVYVVAPDGAIGARYDKQYLLPFMEYFPLRLELARRRFGRIREFSPGVPLPPLPTRAGRAGVLVCNEALLPHVAGARVAAGAELLVNPSNDSWVPNAGFAEQQLDIVSLRAVEQRTFVVRVSDSGPSAVIDPSGRVVARTPPLARAVLVAAVTPSAGRSVYGRVGDLFGLACVAVTGLALVLRRRV